MRTCRLDHVSDDDLRRALIAAVANERGATATVIAHIAEFDARRLYAPAGYPSMREYCVRELRMSEDAAAKRIQAARTAQRVPALLAALADGRLHLSGVCLLAPHLTPENAEELLVAATGRSKSQIELLVAERFPQPDVPTSLSTLAPGNMLEHAPGHVPLGMPNDNQPLAALTGSSTDHASARIVREPFPRVRPLAPERFALQVTIGQGTHEKLRHAQALLSHAIPSGDLETVLDRALDALIAQLEKRKFGTKCEPRRGSGRSTTRPRSIPAHVRHAVWQRDQGRCTFVSDSGRRCSASRFLELDHADPVARGGPATVENLRLRCRTHNQYEAEQAFGTGFMDRKREATRHAAEDRARDVAPQHDPDILAGLRGLGLSANEARRAAEYSTALHDAPLEERMLAALRSLRPKVSQGGAQRASGLA